MGRRELASSTAIEYEAPARKVPCNGCHRCYLSSQRGVVFLGERKRASSSSSSSSENGMGHSGRGDHA